MALGRIWEKKDKIERNKKKEKKKGTNKGRWKGNRLEKRKGKREGERKEGGNKGRKAETKFQQLHWCCEGLVPPSPDANLSKCHCIAWVCS